MNDHTHDLRRALAECCRMWTVGAPESAWRAHMQEAERVLAKTGGPVPTDTEPAAPTVEDQERAGCINPKAAAAGWKLPYCPHCNQPVRGTTRGDDAEWLNGLKLKKSAAGTSHFQLLDADSSLVGMVSLMVPDTAAQVATHINQALAAHKIEHG